MGQNDIVTCYCVIVKIKIQHGTIGMTGIQLRCGASGCGYVTEEVTMDIAWGLHQFHRQDNHAQHGGG